jgi:hypothetical protein
MRALATTELLFRHLQPFGRDALDKPAFDEAVNASEAAGSSSITPPPGIFL